MPDAHSPDPIPPMPRAFSFKRLSPETVKLHVSRDGMATAAVATKPCTQKNEPLALPVAQEKEPLALPVAQKNEPLAMPAAQKKRAAGDAGGAKKKEPLAMPAALAA